MEAKEIEQLFEQNKPALDIRMTRLRELEERQKALASLLVEKAKAYMGSFKVIFNVSKGQQDIDLNSDVLYFSTNAMASCYFEEVLRAFATKFHYEYNNQTSYFVPLFKTQ